MGRCLSGGLRAVVTADTTAGDRRVVHDGAGSPTGGGMAIRTLAIGGHVVGGFGSGLHDTTLRMAAGAFAVGFGECATDMAAFAGHDDVRTIEHKAGAEVIESGLRTGVPRNSQSSHDDNHGYEGK